MLSAAEKLAAELGEDSKPKTNGSKRRANVGLGDVFELANGIDTERLLGHLGIVCYDGPSGKRFCDCVGCGEADALLCDGGGTHCFHDRCKDAGPSAKHDGFRTNIDIVAHRENAAPLDAAKLICGWFGIDVPKKTNGQTRTADEPPEGYDVDQDWLEGNGQAANADKPETEEPTRAASDTSPPRIEIIDAAAIMATLEEPTYLVQGIIRSASITEIAAYGGSGKSWLGADLLLSVDAGEPWLGLFPCTKGVGVYLDYENGSYEMRRRLQAIARARKLRPERFRLSSMPSVYMSDAAKFAAAVQPLAETADLIIIDTLRAASPGLDENDSRMRIGLDAARRLGEASGCAFVILVHGKKTSASVNTIDPREAGRGSSAIYDAADVVLHVAYTEGKPLRVTQTKARFGRLIDPFLVTIEDADGGTLVRAESASQSASQGAGSSDAKFMALCDDVHAALGKHPGASKRLLAEQLSKRPTSIAAALEMLKRNGAVTSVGAGQTERWFVTVRGGSDD